ncbi:hypothetical protein GF402_00625 [Candidatus Fermentibacteria bacterium]|nr:hypothetical protein [Candidatus Fermentibacteria bacterium]
MIRVIVVFLILRFSPSDSADALITLADVPQRALSFARMAAEETGGGCIELGRLLEVSGRFEEASRQYGLAMDSATDPVLRNWLADRMRGSAGLDTVMMLDAQVMNLSSRTAYDLTLVTPLPASHPPYQAIQLVGTYFERAGPMLRCRIDSVPAGDTLSVPILIHVIQHPHTYRPLPDTLGGLTLKRLSLLLRDLDIPERYEGTGPCLEMASALRRMAEEQGLEMEVVGGLVRRGDSLVFHAWNLLTDSRPGLPIDPLLFRSDSLRGLGHCPTDMIPVWDLLSTQGHEVSVYFPGQQADLEVRMTAKFLTGETLDELGKGYPASELLRRMLLRSGGG